MPFAIPIIWAEPTNHSSHCYFCLTDTKGITITTKSKIKYPEMPSAKRPIPHSEDLPVFTHKAWAFEDLRESYGQEW